MKTLLLADLHTEKASKLVRTIVQQEGVDTLAFLGDVDTPDVLKNLLNSVRQNNLRFIYTPGNHEYHFVNYEKGLCERAVLDYFARVWNESPDEKQFVKDASKISPSDKSLIVTDREVVYAHASVVDYPSQVNPHVSDIMWGRLQINDDLLGLTFKVMRDLDGFRLFFRGHDHAPAIYTYDYNQTKKLDQFQGKFQLNPDKFLAIATVGAFRDGFYAVYDSENQEIDFRRLKVVTH